MSTTMLDRAAIPASARPRTGIALRSGRGSAAGRLISPVMLVLVRQAASTVGLLSPRTLAFPARILATSRSLLASGELVYHVAVSLGRVIAVYGFLFPPTPGARNAQIRNLGAGVIAVQQPIANLYTQAGLIVGHIDVGGLFDTSFNDAVTA